MKGLERILDLLLTAPGEKPGTLMPRASLATPATSTPVSAPVPHTVFLLLDVSGSMDQGKLRQARDGGLSFAEDAIRKGYQVGVIQFTSWARVQTRPTGRLGAIRAGLSEPGLKLTTNMAAAVGLATRELRGIQGVRAMVLVTDGYPDSADAALEAAREAKQHDITIIAIGTDDADRNFLRQLASASELATTVPDNDLGVTIAKAAALLPARTASAK